MQILLCDFDSYICEFEVVIIKTNMEINLNMHFEHENNV